MLAVAALAGLGWAGRLAVLNYPRCLHPTIPPLAPHPTSPQVVVAEASPTYQGQQMATELGALGIHATLVADSAIFAMMARVNKVGLRDGDMLLRCLLPATGWQAAEPANWWLSPRCLKHRPLHLLPARLGVQVVATAQALLANGGVMAPVGMHTVAMAARRHSVPVVVLCGIYKLSTLFPHNPGGWAGVGAGCMRRGGCPDSGGGFAVEKQPTAPLAMSSLQAVHTHMHVLAPTVTPPPLFPPCLLSLPQPSTSTTSRTPQTCCPTATLRWACRARPAQRPCASW